MATQTNSFQIISSKVVNFKTKNAQGSMKIEYGTKRPFCPSFYSDGEHLYIVMSEYVEVNGQKIPMTVDYYSPTGNFRLHSSFSGASINPKELVKGSRNFDVRDVAHVELVSRHDDLASMTIEIMSLIDLNRNSDYSGMRQYV